MISKCPDRATNSGRGNPIDAPDGPKEIYPPPVSSESKKDILAAQRGSIHSAAPDKTVVAMDANVQEEAKKGPAHSK